MDVVAPGLPERASLRGVTRGIVKMCSAAENPTARSCWVLMGDETLDVFLVALTSPSLHLDPATNSKW